MASLKKKGIARQFVEDNFNKFEESGDLKVGHVLQIYYSASSSVGKTITILRSKCQSINLPAPDVYQSRKKIQTILARVSKLKKLTDSAEFSKFSSLCASEFKIQSSHAEVIGLSVTEDSVPATPQPSCSNVPATPQPSCSNVPTTPQLSRNIVSPSPKHCVNCKHLRIRLKTAIKLRRQLCKQQSVRISTLKEQLAKKPSVRVFNQNLKRKNIKIVALKKKMTMNDNSDLKKTQSQLHRLKRKCNELKQSVQDGTAIKKLKLQVNKKDDIIENLEHEVDRLQNPCDDTFIKENKKFSDRTRRFVYDSLVNQVPTGNIPTLIVCYSALFGVELSDKDVPHRTTVEQMARELGVISDIQTANAILGEKNLTLGFDATTQEGVHINSIHTTFKSDRCLVVAVDQLAAGKATDYKSHITDSFDNLARIYCLYENTDYQQCRQQLIDNISNSMTDRVVVNHASIELLNQSWNKTLTELNCHLHPLDTIASSVRSTLKAEESDNGKLFGTDCMSGNIILQMNKMRFKDGKGDPQGFKTMLSENKLPLGFIPRYRGNRLHIFFNICGKYFAYHDIFVTYLLSGKPCGGLRHSLSCDFSNPTAIVELHVAGLLGKLLTGPWMTKFYTSAETEINHFKGIAVVKRLIETLKRQISDVTNVRSRSTDFFGACLEHVMPPKRKNGKTSSKEMELIRKANILAKLQKEPHDTDLFNILMGKCLSVIVTVLERQYQKYFKLKVTQELILQTESARSHNIDAEEVMGMFSAAQKKSPNATMIYLSCKLRAQKNRTTDYLNSLTPEQQAKLINFAITEGRKLNQRKRKEATILNTEIGIRRASVRQKKHMRDRKKIENTVKVTPISDLKSAFPELDEVQINCLTELLEGKAIGVNITHTWLDDDTQNFILYSGKIEKMKKQKRKGVDILQNYVVCYWSENESYDDGVDYDMTKYELAVDYLMDDLVFLK